MVIDLAYINIFLLIFVRITGLFVISPIFSRRNMPGAIKIGFSLMLALILINTLKVQDIHIQYNNILEYVGIIAKEFLTGLTLGYVAYLIFTAVHFAGQIIDMQVGFGMVNVIDPVSNIQVPITANFYYIMAMLLFLVCNGHHVLIKALFESFNTIPINGSLFGDFLLYRYYEIMWKCVCHRI